MTTPRCVNLRPHEVRRLLEVGSVRVVRACREPIEDSNIFEIVNNGVVKYRRPAGHPMLDEARKTPGYSVRSVLDGWLEFCPFGAPGETVRVREAWAYTSAVYVDQQAIYYAADGAGVGIMQMTHDEDEQWLGDALDVYEPERLRSPATMPAWASRLSAVVDDVRACRVQEVTEAEAIEAGAQSPGVPASLTNRGALAKLHNKHVTDPAAKWERNPHVWNALITRSDK